MFSHKHLFALVLIGIAIYLCLFFATPFEPYRSAEQAAPARAFFFSCLLLPDEYCASWLGPDGVIALWDRLPILGYTLLCLLAATGWGNIFLLPSTKKMARSSDRAQCNKAKEAAARDGGVYTDGSNFTRKGTFFHKHIRLATLEHWLFATVLGLGIVSIGLFWCLFIQYPPLGLPWFTSFSITFGIIYGLVFLTPSRVSMLGDRHSLTRYPREGRRQEKLPPFSIFHFQFSIFAVFAALTLLAGMIPSTDYDVLSYHLAGAREIFEAGKIEFLPHNVYANMPFGAEMFAVWGMALSGDAFTGALVGKTLIAATTIITALGIFAFCRRFFSIAAGLWGVILYISTPWIVYVSSAGLIDTVVGMYAFFAIYAAFLFREKINAEQKTNWPLLILTGFLAGCAAACKYPALLFVVLPIGIWIMVPLSLRERGSVRAEQPSEQVPRPKMFHLIIFSLGVLLACGGWYFKNWYFTGNPVYPLCYNIFGDTTGTWTPEIDGRWSNIHSPHGFGLGQFLGSFLSVALTSPWNSPLVVPLALLSPLFLKKGQRKFVGPLWCWLGFFFAAWWLSTHRIDRFWLPVMPVLCVLAGLGTTWIVDKGTGLSNGSKYGLRISVVFFMLGLVYCFLVAAAPAPGKLNRYLASLESMQNDAGVYTPWAVWFNRNPPSGRILLVGDARAFLYGVRVLYNPVLYNTCWNETPLKEIVESKNPKEEFRQRNITTVLVDWAEIRRFRSPGNYGYSEFVQQEVFAKLVAEGILEQFVPTKELADAQTVAYRVVE